MPPSRATYTGPALVKYLNHIRLPASYSRTLPRDPAAPDTVDLNIAPAAHSYMRGWGTSTEGSTFLHALQKYQLCRIPFANLHLHYSTHKKGTLDAGLQFEYLVNSAGIAAEASFHAASPTSMRILSPSSAVTGKGEREAKWVGRSASGGRGASCTMNNGFFGTVMRSLGMRVRMAGARVATSFGGPGGRRAGFGGWNHQINLVEFEGKMWLVDVGFGGQGPTAPMELRDGNEQPWGATSDSVRLIYTNLPEHEHSTSRCWVFQHKKQGQAWIDCYAFTTEEFLPQDLAVLNFKSTQDIRGSFFNQLVICVRFLMQDTEEIGEQIVGTVGMVDGVVKKRVYVKEGMGGRWEKQDVRRCKTELERWEVLESEFGIVLGEQERVGIEGLVTELKSRDEGDGAFLDG